MVTTILFNDRIMETSTFASWLELFKNTVKEQPLLLLSDGYMGHISIAVIEDSTR